MGTSLGDARRRFARLARLLRDLLRTLAEQATLCDWYERPALALREINRFPHLPSGLTFVYKGLTQRVGAEGGGGSTPSSLLPPPPSALSA